MVETARNPETGGYAVRRAGRGWEEVDQETYEAVRRDAEAAGRGVLGNLAREAGAQLVDQAGELVSTVSGGNALGAGLGLVTGQYAAQQAPGMQRVQEAGRDLAAVNDPQQAARYRQFPGIGVAAGAATLGAELAVPLGGPARLGGRLPGMPGQRVVGETTAKAVATAEEVVARSRGGAADRPGRSVGAMRNPQAPPAPEERALRGLLTEQEVDDLANELDLGPVLTPGDRAALRARVDTDELSRADARRAFEERSRSSLSVNALSSDVNQKRGNAANAATRLVMNELGEGRGFRLTSENMRVLEKQSSDTFDSAAREAGDIPVKPMVYAELQDVADDVGADDFTIVQRAVDDIIKDIKDNAGVLPNRLVRDHRTKLGRRAVRAAAGGNIERANALRDLQQWLDARVDERVSPETQEALREARYRWRIIRALESSSASTDAAGNVNLPSFIRSYQRAGNRFFKSTGKEGARGEEFSRALETFRFLTAKVEPDSGTAGRLLHNLVGKVPGLNLLD